MITFFYYLNKLLFRFKWKNYREIRESNFNDKLKNNLKAKY